MASWTSLSRRRFSASLLASALIPGTALSWSSDPPLTRIAFGSCAKQHSRQPIWDAIAREHPDLFLFLGDTVYADTTDPVQLRKCYARLRSNEAFKRFRKSCPIHAVWDDHDYGLNDGGEEHPTKADLQQIFLDAFDVSSDDPLREQQGLYRAFVQGPPGQRVQFLILDTRYHRSPLSTFMIAGRTLYLPSYEPGVTMLGAAQWDWLEAQLQVPVEVRIVCSSIQVLPVDHPFEKWENFPTERRRLLDLLGQSSGLTLLLSGDQHMAEVTAQDIVPGRRLYELTSSGMTHTRGAIPALNSLRVGELVVDRNFGIVELDWNAPGGVRAEYRVHRWQGEVLLQKRIPHDSQKGWEHS